MWTAAHQGVRVPNDVLIVGFDGTAVDELIEPTLTTVAQPFDRIAVAAVDLLQALVHGRRDVRSTTIAAELVRGGSTRPSDPNRSRRAQKSDSCGRDTADCREYG